jgi:hypothetical protein
MAAVLGPVFCKRFPSERGQAMTDEQKRTYPVIPATHWWTLRERFKQSIPANVTPVYLATALDMKEKSAKSNILPSLVLMGLVDQEGKPTGRAKRWRDDLEYPQLCAEIRSELYPQELLDAAPGPTVDRAAAERWFGTTTGLGTSAVKRFALVYELLTTATLPGMRERSPRPTEPKSAVTRKAKSEASPVPAIRPEEALSSLAIEPSIHIDIQVHISPDAKPDQIDQIFASMAKHLRRRND